MLGYIDPLLGLGLVLLVMILLLVKLKLIKRSRWKKIGHGQDGVPRWVRERAYHVMGEIERKNMQPDVGEETHVIIKGRRYRYKIVLKGWALEQGVRRVSWDRTYRTRRRRRRRNAKTH